MEIEIVGIVIRVYSDPTRNLDRQQENLLKIKQIIEIQDFQWPMSDTPGYWEVLVSIPLNQAALEKKIKSAISRARKKKDRRESSEVELNYIRRGNYQREYEYRQKMAGR